MNPPAGALTPTPGATFVTCDVTVTAGMAYTPAAERPVPVVFLQIDGAWVSGADDHLDLVIPALPLLGSAGLGAEIVAAALAAANQQETGR